MKTILPKPAALLVALIETIVYFLMIEMGLKWLFELPFGRPGDMNAGDWYFTLLQPIIALAALALSFGMGFSSYRNRDDKKK